MSGVETVFFDLDGTLTDPRIGITRCIQHALEQLGAAVPAADDLTWCIGPPLLETFQSMLGDDGSAQAALIHYRERFSEIGLFENEVYEDIPSAIGHLADSGVPLFVATSKPQVYAERIVEHFGLGPYFEHVFGPTLDGVRSSKTDLLRYALGQIGAAPDTAVMVGDRRHDMIGARENGVAATGVLYGYGSRQELEAAGAQALLSNPGEIARILEP